MNAKELEDYISRLEDRAMRLEFETINANTSRSRSDSVAALLAINEIINELRKMAS